MLKVLIRLFPRGDESKATTIGEMEIANVGGTVSVGEYAVRLFKRGSKAVWKRGSVLAFPRLSRGPYDLVFRALANIVAGRNKVVSYPKAWELEEESMANVEAMMLREQGPKPPHAASAVLRWLDEKGAAVRDAMPDYNAGEAWETARKGAEEALRREGYLSTP